MSRHFGNQSPFKVWAGLNNEFCALKVSYYNTLHLNYAKWKLLAALLNPGCKLKYKSQLHVERKNFDFHSYHLIMKTVQEDMPNRITNYYLIFLFISYLSNECILQYTGNNNISKSTHWCYYCYSCDKINLRQVKSELIKWHKSCFKLWFVSSSADSVGLLVIQEKFTHNECYKAAVNYLCKNRCHQ